MIEKDTLQRAKEMAMENYTSSTRGSTANALAAIAYSIIALVERIDDLTNGDCAIAVRDWDTQQEDAQAQMTMIGMRKRTDETTNGMDCCSRE